MRKLINWARSSRFGKACVIAGVAAALAEPVSSKAQLALDYGSMTNTANLFATATTASGNALIPVTIGIILLCAGIGVWYRMASKARIRS